jgi:hypothetical protein
MTSREFVDARARAAAAARALLAGEIPWESWASDFANSGDADIDRLGDLLEHQPGRVLALGVDAAEFKAQYERRLEAAIRGLESGGSAV